MFYHKLRLNVDYTNVLWVSEWMILYSLKSIWFCCDSVQQNWRQIWCFILSLFVCSWSSTNIFEIWQIRWRKCAVINVMSSWNFEATKLDEFIPFMLWSHLAIGLVPENEVEPKFTQFFRQRTVWHWKRWLKFSAFAGKN